MSTLAFKNGPGFQKQYSRSFHVFTKCIHCPAPTRRGAIQDECDFPLDSTDTLVKSESNLTSLMVTKLFLVLAPSLQILRRSLFRLRRHYFSYRNTFEYLHLSRTRLHRIHRAPSPCRQYHPYLLAVHRRCILSENRGLFL